MSDMDQDTVDHGDIDQGRIDQGRIDQDRIATQDEVVLYDVAALEASRRRHPANHARREEYVAEGLCIGGLPVFN